ncbi:MAG: FAD-dependent oxidoreductase [Canidatus Methanoxibalbensis ujae]|nr:FAD-dependent oxidoreductase [Candidatus Methanoxibalbensis ujae]
MKKRRAIRIGVYVCHCGLNIAAVVDVEEVVRYASSLENVVVAREYRYMCSDPGQELIMNDIREFDLNGVVVASCSPRIHEQTFRACCMRAGLNPFLFEHANIREQCSWVHDDREKATEKAKSIVRGAVAKVAAAEPLERYRVGVCKDALVIGGGIAGIQSALDIADAGFNVYLVEREPSIGGNMARLDKTFPTLDCSACILTPKMVEVSRHENITLITYAEVESVEGYVGNFNVRIRKKPRYVDENRCTGCGECAKICPQQEIIPNVFDCGLSKTAPVFIPFPQAIPLTYTILKRDGKPPCELACPAGVNVQGYIALIRAGRYKEAVDLIRKTNPLPSVCGYVCHNPCEDECNRREVDEAVAIRALKRFVTDRIVGTEEDTPAGGDEREDERGDENSSTNSSALSETALAMHQQRRQQQQRQKKQQKSVAIIGSGPAGLGYCEYFHPSHVCV